MSNSYFKFKKFTIEQDDCAMKVGTDGCLLGAWFDVENSKNILDIGAGTGLISIMAAQRSKAAITGVEIDAAAAKKAAENASRSPWSERIKIINSDIQSCHFEAPFDTIVSNPPFFTNSLKCDDNSRTLARHTDNLSPSTLFSCAQRLLTSNGKLSLIIPADSLNNWQSEALYKGFSLHRTTYVKTTPKKQAKRVLVEFRKKATILPLENTLILESTPGMYSPEATALLQDFYLKLGNDNY